MDSDGKESACNTGDMGSIPGIEGKGMATHSSILACRIPWTEEPEELQSIGSQRVGDDNKKISPVKSIQDIIKSLD